MAATVVQVGTPVGFNNTATAAVSLTGVTAGNSILIFCPLYSDGTPADPSATSYTLARRGSITNGSSSRSASFLYRHNVASGTHNITVNTSAASGYRYGYAIPFEVSGLQNAAPDVTYPTTNSANGANDASPLTGTSGSTTAANCFVLVGMCLAANTADAGIDTPATTGYTNRGVRQISTSETAYSFDTKSVTSAGTQSGAWGTLTASTEWAAVLVAFAETTATGYTITADGGSFTLTGAAAGLKRGLNLVASGGSYTLTGADALRDFSMATASGTFTLTGAAATLKHGYNLVASGGSFTLTGDNSALVYARKLVASSGSYTLTGADAGLTYSGTTYNMPADGGSFTLTGADVGLQVSRRLTAESGSFVLTGADVTLTKINAYRLVADSGSYAYTGASVNLIYSGAPLEGNGMSSNSIAIKLGI